MKCRLFSFAAVPALLLPLTASAAPYASAVTDAGANISFVLNEPADSVRVVFNEPLPALEMGALAAGPHTFPKGASTSFQIVVEKNAGPGWKSGVLQQISDDTSELVKFTNCLGLAVNRKPDTGKLFGRVYVSCSQNGTAAPVTTPVSPSRAIQEGIYVLNAGLAATELGSGALLGGLTFSTPATGADGASPYRLSVGDKGDLFIADWSDASGSVYKTDGDVANGKNVLGGPTIALKPPLPEGTLHGSIAGMVTSGSEQGGDLKLWVVDEDLQDDPTSATPTMINSIWAWDTAGAPLPIETPPLRFNIDNNIGINFATQTADLAQGPDGTFYKTQRRAAGNESGVFALDADGNTLSSVPPSEEGEPVFGSKGAFQIYSGVSPAADPFLETRGCDVSADGWLALIRSDNAIHLVKVDAGVIDFDSHILLHTKPTTIIGRDIAFDAAGNLYTISSGQSLLRVFSPGGHTRATTSSSGAFTITDVTPAVPAPRMELQPVVTGLTASGADYTLQVTSRLGLASTLTVQRSPDLGSEEEWETLLTTEYTITGDAPNFTVLIKEAARGESRYFYRVRRL
ncbi:MAG: hypothetical protein EOP86_01180 [Verrucomicrobiaceae bacterium]|nr:MAG: hypothetical protein EOP86_01180 [Verrucomicrobiaceae bacterium]